MLSIVLTANCVPCACGRAVSKCFKGKEIEKGVAVPTCVSINKCVRQQHWAATAITLGCIDVAQPRQHASVCSCRAAVPRQQESAEGMFQSKGAGLPGCCAGLTDMWLRACLSLAC